uniref:ATP synthase F0 subunit 8 n=1 Tax=Macrostemum floridum TaxID=486976 RepID=A0A7L8XGL2_9NEOP|nr:ATP synthase F0 subunit 8 [Macrostemum floridum]QOH91255.1 ATP synthase F0 subunit 8 [Macrostemum floridum]
MPQMMPLNWIFLSIFFSILLLILLTSFFFLKINFSTPSLNLSSNQSSTFISSWKW